MNILQVLDTVVSNKLGMIEPKAHSAPTRDVRYQSGSWPPEPGLGSKT
jgi:hypothetical protein